MRSSRTCAEGGDGRQLPRRGSLAAPLAGLCLAAPEGAHAAITGGVREAIADFTSNMPGYGPGDIYYPEWFLGDWDATSELTAVDTPQGEQQAGRPALAAKALVGTAGSVEKYVQRFIDYRGKVIADRAFNIRGLVRGNAPRGVEDVEWDPTNPNALALVMKKDGASQRVEFLVTRRATGVPEGRTDLFNASEFYQETVNGSDFGVFQATSGAPPPVMVPKVTPVRCVNKFRKVAGPQIQLIQRVEVFSTFGSEAGQAGARDVGDLLRGGGGDPNTPVAVYRYRVLLVPAGTSAGGA